MVHCVYVNSAVISTKQSVFTVAYQRGAVGTNESDQKFGHTSS